MQRFSQFYRTSYPLALAVAERRLPSLEVAEDVTAEAFFIAWEKYGRGAELTVPWLYTIVRNVIGNQYQKQDSAKELISRIGFEQTTRPSTTDDETGLDLTEALALLTDDQQELIAMVYWDELTTVEVADILGCREGAVRARLHRARQALARTLDQTLLTSREVPR